MRWLVPLGVLVGIAFWVFLLSGQVEGVELLGAVAFLMIVLGLSVENGNENDEIPRQQGP